MNAVVVGGGLLGLSAGYYLARKGVSVTVLESSSQLGGLATDVEVAGVQVDRFYHCILNADNHLLGLIDEVGLRDQLVMHPVRAGFHTNGKTYPISTPLDLLRFPPLSPLDRLRLIRSLFACRRVKDWHELEAVDVATWLQRYSGKRVFETVWRPLLSAKFDGNFEQTPATYIWSRTVRMTDTRSAGGQKELAGHLIGGYRTLAERLAQSIAALGGQVLLNQPAEQLHTNSGAVSAVTAGGRRHDAELVVLTAPLPLSGRLLRGCELQGNVPVDQLATFDRYVNDVEQVDGYLGVICLLLMLRRPLSPYYTLYLADRRLPFTAVVETTNLIDPALVDGHHLVYLPKYVDPLSELFQMPDELVRTWFLTELRQIYPDFSQNDIVAAPVFRAPHVEPLHPMGMHDRIPSMQTPVAGLWLGSTKHFYPRLNSGEAVVRLGHELAQRALEVAPAPRAHAEVRDMVRS